VYSMRQRMPVIVSQRVLAATTELNSYAEAQRRETDIEIACCNVIDLIPEARRIFLVRAHISLLSIVFNLTNLACAWAKAKTIRATRLVVEG
jgi:hypothetical protein